MSDVQLIQKIKTGNDPRNLPEFSAIREEINKASHPSQPEMNWVLVESLALTLFKNNGVDLHTATYYTLARTRIHGLSGFCEGVELLAALISHEWDKFWPQSEQARTEMLDWFNARTGNILRQQLSWSETDLPLMYRAERALQAICDKLQQVELKRIPRVENLLYFVQNTRKRFEQPAKHRTVTPLTQTAIRTLVYAPDSPEIVEERVPATPEVKIEVQTERLTVPEVGKKGANTAKGFMAGCVCSLIIATALWWWKMYPLQQQIGKINSTAQGAASLWRASPELEDYGLRLQQLLKTSPLGPLETGMSMTHLANSRWPDNLQQQQATAQWHEALRYRAQHSPQLNGWQQTRQELRAFADLIMQREKEGITLSYIKNVVWQAERTLNQETPLESLLTQYQTMLSQEQNTEILEKEINERISGVLSRWLLLKSDIPRETQASDSIKK